MTQAPRSTLVAAWRVEVAQFVSVASFPLLIGATGGLWMLFRLLEDPVYGPSKTLEMWAGTVYFALAWSLPWLNLWSAAMLRADGVAKHPVRFGLSCAFVVLTMVYLVLWLFGGLLHGP